MGGPMSVGSVDAIERSVHKTNEWLHQPGAERGTEDREDAWRVLRAYLQLLRDQLTVDEAAQLAAQLPMVLRGTFYEAFDPGHQPARIRSGDEFLSAFAERTKLDPERATQAVEAATRVLRSHVTAGEFDDVLAQLPRELREV